MFDRKTYKNETNYPSRIDVTVKEQKAPTDESIRLALEMEEKVKASLLKRIDIETNYIKAVCLLFRNNAPFCNIEYRIKFTINDKEYNLQYTVDEYEFKEQIQEHYSGFGNEAIYVAFHKKLSEIIAMELMKQSPESMKSLQPNQ